MADDLFAAVDARPSGGHGPRVVALYLGNPMISDPRDLVCFVIHDEENVETFERLYLDEFGEDLWTGHG
jgi:hypothetical protein